MHRSGIVQLVVLAFAVLGAPVSAQPAAPPKCSPPVRVDMSLQAQLKIEGGGGAYVGRSGLLHFSATNHGPFAAHSFRIGHALVPVPSGSAQTFRLQQVEGSCHLNEWYEPGSFDWPEGIYYTVNGQRVEVGETVTCSIGIEVLPAATLVQPFEFWLRPYGCVTDINWDDNYATVFVGGSPPAPVPLVGVLDRAGRWAWLLLVLALIATGGLHVHRARRRHQSP